jgi:hypothetical protein
VSILGATLQNTAPPRCRWPVYAITGSCRAMRAAGWAAGGAEVHCPACNPCMHACSSLGGAKVRVTRHNHVCLTFTGRGIPVGRHRADMLRMTWLRTVTHNCLASPRRKAATLRRRLTPKNTSSTAYTGGVRCQWRSAALRGKWHSRHPKRGG